MRKLHAMTGPDNVSDSELLFFTCFTSTLAPFAINGKSAPFGSMPWKPYVGHSIQAITRVECECIQSHSAGASLNSASGNLTLVGNELFDSH